MRRITPKGLFLYLLIGFYFVIIISFSFGSKQEIVLNLLLIGFMLVFAGFYSLVQFGKTEKIIFDIDSLPSMSTSEASEGVPFLGEGIVESQDNKILYAPCSNTPCLYFHSIKERLVTQGKNRYWKMVENKAAFVPFYLKDKSGKIKIDLNSIDKDFSGYQIPLLKDKKIPDFKNSEIDCRAVFKRVVYKEKGRGFLGKLFASTYRKTEYVLEPKTKVFVHGYVKKAGDELTLCEHGENLPLIISQKSRSQYVQEFYKGSSLIYYSIPLIALGYSSVFVSIKQLGGITQFQLVTALLAGNIAIIIFGVVKLYNRIVTLRQRAQNALSNIKIELKRRSDLIPNLIGVIQGYAKHEKEVQKIIAQAREGLQFSKELRSSSEPEIPALVAVLERYPSIGASENYQNFRERLIETEKRIMYAREFYNKNVRKHNVLIEQFPFSLLAWVFRIKPLDFAMIKRQEISTKKTTKP